MFIQLQKILFPSDFSELSKHARNYAMLLTEQFGAELHLLHVVPQVTVPIPESTLTWTLPPDDQKKELDETNARLLQEIGSKWAESHRVVRASVVGYPIEDIIKYSNNHEIDLIVMGTHGHTGFSHMLLGSVAEKVVRIAKCPVLTVHAKGHQFLSDEDSPSTKEVLIQ